MRDIKDIWSTVIKRWEKAMPRFFKVLMCICALIGGTAISAQTALVTFGATPHEWWNDLYPYLIGGSFGAAFVCKFTVNGGFRGEKIDPTVTGYDKESHMED